MRPASDRRIVAHLAAAELSVSDIAYIAQIPRATVRDWLLSPPPERPEPRLDIAGLPAAEYSYLLGVYLGDGTLSSTRRAGYRLRITMDSRYPEIIAECVAAMQAVMPQNVVHVQQTRDNAVEISCYSRLWIQAFPQHGPGRKHTRKIELAPWQEDIRERHPREFLRGLIHSDGCRVLNRVNGKEYPRYFFTQVSGDIRELFCRTCRQLGIEYTRNDWKNVSIARGASVAVLDSFVGPKA
jgi:hypothetical protein